MLTTYIVPGRIVHHLSLDCRHLRRARAVKESAQPDLWPGFVLRGVSHQFRVPELRRRLAVLRVRGYVNTMTNRPEVFVVSGVTPDDVRTWYEVPETVPLLVLSQTGMQRG